MPDTRTVEQRRVAAAKGGRNSRVNLTPERRRELASKAGSVGAVSKKKAAAIRKAAVVNG